MQRVCDACGREYEAKRESSRFCGATCRQRSRRGASAVPAVLPQVVDDAGPVTAAAVAELEGMERLETPLGRAAVALAARIDAGTDTGAGFASLVKQFQATFEAATAGAAVDVTKLDRDRDELAARRKARGA